MFDYMIYLLGVALFITHLTIFAWQVGAEGGTWVDSHKGLWLLNVLGLMAGFLEFMYVNGKLL